MGTRHLRPWTAATLTIVGGCVCIGATFLRWGSTIEGAYFNRSEGAPAYAGVFRDGGENAWEAFSGLDIALATFGGLAVIAGLLALSTRTPALRNAAGLVISIAGLCVGAWVLERAFNEPQPAGTGPGTVLGFGSIVLAVTGAWLSTPSRRQP
jgi:hypothetical protein